MTSQAQFSGAPSAPRNTILHGDCVTLMDTIPEAASISSSPIRPIS